MQALPSIHWAVVSNGIEDDPEVYFSCATKELAIKRAQEQLEEDLLEKSEYDDQPPDVVENKDDSDTVIDIVVSYDDYMSYKITPVPHYTS